MGKKTENLEIPPKNSKTQNSRENTEILADETMKEKEGELTVVKQVKLDIIPIEFSRNFVNFPRNSL